MHTRLKKIVFFFACLCSIQSHAQADSTTVTGLPGSYTHILDSLFAPIDKGRIPYGILYDRVFPFANLADSSASDTMNTDSWIQAFSEMQRADYSYVHDDSVLDYSDIKNYCYSENRKGAYQCWASITYFQEWTAMPAQTAGWIL